VIAYQLQRAVEKGYLVKWARLDDGAWIVHVPNANADSDSVVTLTFDSHTIEAFCLGLAVAS
jgi:hypothetical protein